MNDKVLNDNKIPGSDQLTRPEEIKMLSKYLGKIKKTQDEHTKLSLDNLEVPGRTTGRIPKISELGDKVIDIDGIKEITELQRHLDKDNPGLTLDIEGVSELKEKMIPISSTTVIEGVGDLGKDIEEINRLQIPEPPKLSKTSEQLEDSREFIDLGDYVDSLNDADLKVDLVDSDPAQLQGDFKNLNKLGNSSIPISEVPKELRDLVQGPSVKLAEDHVNKGRLELVSEGHRVNFPEDHVKKDKLKDLPSPSINLNILPEHEIDKLESPKKPLELGEKFIEDLPTNTLVLSAGDFANISKLGNNREDIYVSSDLEVEELSQFVEEKIKGISQDSTELRTERVIRGGEDVVVELEESKEELEVGKQGFSELEKFRENLEDVNKHKDLETQKETLLVGNINNHIPTSLEWDSVKIYPETGDIKLGDISEKLYGTEDLGLELPKEVVKNLDNRDDIDLIDEKSSISKIDTLKPIELHEDSESLHIEYVEPKLKDDIERLKNLKELSEILPTPKVNLVVGDITESPLQLETEREDLQDDRSNNLSDEVISLGDLRENALGEKVIDLEDNREVELEDTRVDVLGPQDKPLSDTILKILDSRSNELSNVILKLIDARENSLPTDLIEFEGKDVLEELAKAILDFVEDSKKGSPLGLEIPDERLTQLCHTILKLIDDRVNKLCDVILKITDDRVNELCDVILKITDDRVNELCDVILKLSDDRVNKLCDIILRLVDNRVNKLCDVILTLTDDRENSLEDEILTLIDDRENNLEDEILSQPSPEGAKGQDDYNRFEGGELYDSALGIGEATGTTSQSDYSRFEDGELYSTVLEMGESKGADLQDSYEQFQDGELYDSVIEMSEPSSPVFQNDYSYSENSTLYGTDSRLDLGESLSPDTDTKSSSNVENLPSTTLNRPGEDLELGEIKEGNVSMVGWRQPYKYPRAGLPKFDLRYSLNPNLYLRWIAEQATGDWMHGELRQAVLDEALGILVEGRAMLEEYLDAERYRLPGNLSFAKKSLVDAMRGGVESTVMNLTKNLASLFLPKNDPINRPDDVIKGKKPKVDSWLDGSYSFKENYLNSEGIKTTLEELCFITEIGSVDDLFNAVRQSPYMSTPEKFTSTDNNYNKVTTLDSNDHWEIILIPYVGALNGDKSYLPDIREINVINRYSYGVTTEYSKWIPFTSFELQKSKLTSKAINLYDGESLIPVNMESINELRLSIADDNLRSWRTYFQKCTDVSIYNSEIHDKEYYKTHQKTETGSRETITIIDGMPISNIVTESRITKNSFNSITAVDKNTICVAMYKNVTFRCMIYSMNAQLCTIKKYDLLLTLRDFVEESSGELEASGSELNITFSIVGENPKEELESEPPMEMKKAPKLDKLTKAESILLHVIDKAIKVIM